MKDRRWREPTQDSLEPQGIENGIGDDCFRNGLLQLLINAPAVVYALERHKKADCSSPYCIACSLASILDAYWSHNGDAINRAARDLDKNGNVRGWDREGEYRGQQDPSDFFTWIDGQVRLDLAEYDYV